jgi:hypothetical protein
MNTPVMVENTPPQLYNVFSSFVLCDSIVNTAVGFENMMIQTKLRKIV